MPTILTNKTKIPEVFAEACKIDRHRTYGDISVTGLIDAPQIRFLKVSETVYEDVADRLWMLFGTAMHHILERAEVGHASARQLIDAAVTLDEVGGDKNGKAADFLRKVAKEQFPDAFNDNKLVEKTLSVIINTDIGNLELSGTMDKFLVEEKTLFDYKVTSTYAYTYEESKKKWYAQQNTYAYMLREHGYEVDKAYISALFKDFKPLMKFQNKNYPESMVMDIPVVLQPQEKMAKWLKMRATLHLRSMNGEHIPCTSKEMWATTDKWKIKKDEKGRALNGGVFTIEGMADKFYDDNKIKYPKLIKQFVPGENKRCENYCACSSVCPQFKAIVERNAKMK